MEGNIVKIAVSTENYQVASHFGRCPEFTIAEVKNEEIIDKKVIENPGHKPGFLPRFLAEKEVDCVISGGMGERARKIFAENRIDTVVGVEGKVDKVITSYIQGELSSSDSYCEH